MISSLVACPTGWVETDVVTVEGKGVVVGMIVSVGEGNDSGVGVGVGTGSGVVFVVEGGMLLTVNDPLKFSTVTL